MSSSVCLAWTDDNVDVGLGVGLFEIEVLSGSKRFKSNPLASRFASKHFWKQDFGSSLVSRVRSIYKINKKLYALHCRSFEAIMILCNIFS